MTKIKPIVFVVTGFPLWAFILATAGLGTVYTCIVSDVSYVCLEIYFTSSA